MKISSGSQEWLLLLVYFGATATTLNSRIQIEYPSSKSATKNGPTTLNIPPSATTFTTLRTITTKLTPNIEDTRTISGSAMEGLSGDTDAHLPLGTTMEVKETPTKVLGTEPPEKRYGDQLGPNWFMKKEMTVRCQQARLVYEMEPHENNIPGVDLEGWPNWRVFRNRLDAYDAIRCFCYADLIQPTATETGIPNEKYQEAIDQIPGTVRFLKNTHWKWNMDGLGREPGQSMSWSNQRTRVNDPRIKEPYYLEGPGQERTWDWLRNLDGLRGLGLGGSKFGKRRVDVTPYNKRCLKAEVCVVDDAH
ncbi:hypothetical protein H072_299 [Dactylellina haptotyla CBS 200.50]|uniref:Uncharacterized protein n=1 Tax=Dactylellina haptotyla (strain CBS 200.50) TaxID=1284197 RepID=S8C1W4_DACHA|nr:hypothetical protein H072_299 [Dactylellina haptotyla CBS 200.50]